jgi:hypothetical protein
MKNEPEKSLNIKISLYLFKDFSIIVLNFIILIALVMVKLRCDQFY